MISRLCNQNRLSSSRYILCKRNSFGKRPFSTSSDDQQPPVSPVSPTKHIKFVNINPPSHHSHRQRNDGLVVQSSSAQLQSYQKGNNNNVLPWKPRTLTLHNRNFEIPEILLRQIEAITGATIKQYPSLVNINNIDDKYNNSVKMIDHTPQNVLYNIEISGDNNCVNLAMQQYIQYVQVMYIITMLYIFEKLNKKFQEISNFYLIYLLGCNTNYNWC